MKKFIPLILLINFMVAFSGVVITKHYSNGVFFSSAIYLEAESCCAENHTCSCCSEETEVIKLEDDFNSSSDYSPALELKETIEYFIAFYPYRIATESRSARFYKIKAPPKPVQNTPIFKQNSAYLC